MRTREMSLGKYGVFPEDEKRIREYCRRGMNVEDRRSLLQCAIKVAPGMEIEIYTSLTEKGAGYRTLIQRGWKIPAKEDDFYAYQRKTLYEFYDWLRMNRKM